MKIKTESPSATTIATAKGLVVATDLRAAQSEKALKLAKTRSKSAKQTLKQARKDARKAAKLARKARQRLDELQRQLAKAKRTATVGKAGVKTKARPRVRPVKPKSATPPKPETLASELVILTPVV